MLSSSNRPWSVRYGFAVLCVVLALGIRLALQPLLGTQFPYIIFFFAVLLAAWLGGFWPGVLAVVLSAIGTAAFILPLDGLALTSTPNLVGLGLFLTLGTGLAVFGGIQRAVRQKAESFLDECVRQREELRTTLASIGDAVIVTDPLGKIVSLNPIAAQLTGWSNDEAGRKPVAEIFVIVNEQSGEPVPSPIDRVIRKGTIVGLANHTVLIAKDGTRQPIDDSRRRFAGRTMSCWAWSWFSVT